MVRVKKATNALKTRKNVLKQVKGYRFGRSSKEKMAYEAIAHAGTYAFAHRRDKKGVMRRLWIVKMNAALDPMGLSYSKFIGLLKKKNVLLNRKVLSEIAHQYPAVFERIVKEVTK